MEARIWAYLSVRLSGGARNSIGAKGSTYLLVLLIAAIIAAHARLPLTLYHLSTCVLTTRDEHWYLPSWRVKLKRARAEGLKRFLVTSEILGCGGDKSGDVLQPLGVVVGEARRRGDGWMTGEARLLAP